MKKSLVCVLLVAIFSFVTGCGLIAVPEDLESFVSEAPTEENTFIGGMELVGGSPEERFSYYRDTVTDTIFVFCRSSTVNSQGGGLAVMLDPESGLPLTYARYMEMSRAVATENGS